MCSGPGSTSGGAGIRMGAPKPRTGAKGPCREYQLTGTCDSASITSPMEAAASLREQRVTDVHIYDALLMPTVAVAVLLFSVASGFATEASEPLPKETFRCGEVFVTVGERILDSKTLWVIHSFRKIDIHQFWRYPGHNAVISMEPVALEVPAQHHRRLIDCLD